MECNGVLTPPSKSPSPPSNLEPPESSKFLLPYSDWKSLLLHFSHMFIFLIKCCHNWFLKKLKHYIKETRSYHHTFLFCFCVMTCLSLTLRKKLLNFPKKMFQCLGWIRKIFIPGNFLLKRSSRNMRCKYLHKRFTGKTAECSKHLFEPYCHWKNILS